MKTQVGIIGGGPSGLLLSQLLHLQGIENVVLEQCSRECVLGRIRAGVLEHGFVALMREAEVAERMDREGEIHDGFFIFHDSIKVRVDLKGLTDGSSVIVYGQTEVTRDLYEGRDRLGGVVVHNAEDVQPHDLESSHPYLTYRTGDEVARVDCDYVIGCDGFHGVSRKSIPKDKTTEFERVYPFGWLGVLSRTKPVSPELIYAKHERGFARCSMRSQTLSRYYIQVVPPMGSRGLNSAASHVYYLYHALVDCYQKQHDTGLDSCSERALARVWKGQRFSWWMTTPLHASPTAARSTAGFRRPTWPICFHRRRRGHRWPTTTWGCPSSGDPFAPNSDELPRAHKSRPPLSRPSECMRRRS